MDVKKKGFTVIEILTVLAVIAVLVGILAPSLKMARNMAREAKQRAYMTALDQGIMAYRMDFGDYPPSLLTTGASGLYCGSQKLTEAMLGIDMLGFHSDSLYDADISLYSLSGLLEDAQRANLSMRKGPYLESDKINVHSPGSLATAFGTTLTISPGYVLCDVFGKGGKIEEVGGEQVRAGMPILYYRANRNNIKHSSGRPDEIIYNSRDNVALVSMLNVMTNGTNKHMLLTNFYDYIRDSKASLVPGSIERPYRRDSYILISAGLDGRYGTDDDITNFKN